MRQILLAFFVFALLGEAAGPAAAQTWPERPVTMVIPFPPGGGTDLLGRIVARGLTDVLGQQVVVENVGGAGGMLGSARVVKSAPDGYTMVVGTTADAINQSLYKQLSYKPEDFVPITVLGKVPNLFIVRTFSKAYGLAGMRLGLIAGAEEQTSVLRRMAPPFNVNAVALECLAEALADRQFLEDYVAQVRATREWLRQELEQLKFKCWPSQTNFLLCRFGDDKKAILSALRERGIALRDRPDCEGCVRIGIGTQQEMEHLVAALKQSLAQLPTAKAAR